MPKAAPRAAKSAKTASSSKPRAASGGPRPAGPRPRPTTPVRLLKIAGARPGELKTLASDGPLQLLAAQVTMTGAAAGVSQIGLEIDGELVHIARADLLTARGLSMANPGGAMATHTVMGSVWTVILGWPYPLQVAKRVQVAVQVMEEIPELELALITARA